MYYRTTLDFMLIYNTPCTHNIQKFYTRLFNWNIGYKNDAPCYIYNDESKKFNRYSKFFDDNAFNDFVIELTFNVYLPNTHYILVS